MLLGTQTDVLSSRLGDREALGILAGAGFDCIDYSMFFMSSDPDHVLQGPGRFSYAVDLRKTAESLGLRFHQAHAPFAFRDRTEEGLKNIIFPTVVRSIEVAGVLGADAIIVHPIRPLPYLRENVQKIHEANLQYYSALIPHARRAGVKIAVENMWERDRRRYIVTSACSTPEDFNRMIDDLDSHYITGCLDLGHTGLYGWEAQDVIRAMGGKRLTCLHVHDNNYLEDAHTLPYLGKMNWEEITKALAVIGYSGVFTFEADNFLRPFPEEMLPTAARFMVDTGRYLISQIEKYGSAD